MACGFNRSMQHPVLDTREEDVESEAATKDLLHRRSRKPQCGIVGSKAIRSTIARVFDRHHPSIKGVPAQTGGIRRAPCDR